ncbi:sigma 54-interacting transcriptional regulator [Candidatus Woesearchaeota archaeon]|nr:sigma 54-interacting transcriptional regulator [Candidatus Woesearchaeota archaeon]
MVEEAGSAIHTPGGEQQTAVSRIAIEVDAQKQAPADNTNQDNNEGNIIYGSPQIAKVLKYISVIAYLSGSVLLQGETGTGKELMAQQLHEAGPRKRKPFVGVSCVASLFRQL